jgi:hypothetical protein
VLIRTPKGGEGSSEKALALSVGLGSAGPLGRVLLEALSNSAMRGSSARLYNTAHYLDEDSEVV